MTVERFAGKVGTVSLAEDVQIQQLDPLQVDSRIAYLWEMNEQNDITGKLTLLRDMTESFNDYPGWGPLHCHAAMRDMGMVMGSVRRHGIEPVEQVPGLGHALRAMSYRTRMVPRDTVHHMTRWNPEGPRRRTFTNKLAEKLLIQSVHQSLIAMMAALDICARLVDLPVGTPEFAETAVQLPEHLRALEDSVDIAISGVSPEFFGSELRPHLEPIEIDNEKYYGPAAAHVPVPLLDLALWASDRSSREYSVFIHQIRPYGIPKWDPYYEDWMKRPSLLTLVSHAILRSNGEPEEPLRLAAEALSRSFRALTAFRGKHITLARGVYGTAITDLKQGSAGGDTDQLGTITDLTRNSGTYMRSLLRTAAAGAR